MEHMAEESMSYRDIPIVTDNYSTTFAPLTTNTNISDNIFRNVLKHRHDEFQYLSLLEKIMEEGTWETGRNGLTKSVFGASMRFSLANGTIPILTTKKTAWKTCLKELLWFVRGETDTKLLQQQNVHIWDANSSREFLDSRGLTLYPEHIIGPSYGYQWRFFNANYNCFNGKRLLNDKVEDMHKHVVQFKGVDQLQQIIDALKDPAQRTSRRLVMSAWNPCQMNQMALPPCHMMCQFHVRDGNKLSCMMIQRSCDCFLGVPFNIASYAFLTHLIAVHCGLEADELIHVMGNCHLYENAMDAATVQVARDPLPFPTVSIKQVRENINDYQVDDFIVNQYKSHDAIKVDMVA